MDSELTIGERISASFMSAFSSYPYFSSGLAILVRKVIEIPSATMAVTRDGILLIDPRFVAKHEVPKLAEVLVHELSHLLRDHAGRSDLITVIDRRRWNVAADCEINCGLRRDFLPGDPCLPSKYGLPDGLLAEEYYEKLPSMELDVSAGAGSGMCGSGSGGEVVEGEPAEGNADGRCTADIVRVRREVAAAVVAHASRGVGNIPGDLLRWARRELRPPKIHWRDKLRRIVRMGICCASGKVDYTWSRPGRRQACQRSVGQALGGDDILLPSLQGRFPQIAIGVDTSGSMGEEEITMAMSEVEGVLRTVGVPATFLACDCKVSGPPKKIRSAAEAIRSLRGGGGTDFRVVMAEVERMRPKPNLFIFLTDGDGSASKSPPAGVGVLWVLIGKEARKPAEWGESVVVEEDLEDTTGRLGGAAWLGKIQ